VAPDGVASLLRPGGAPREQVEWVLGATLPTIAGGAPSAPGMLPSHYAPRTPLLLLPSPVAGLDPAAALEAVGEARAVGLLVQSGMATEAEARLAQLVQGRARVTARSLSERGDVSEAARRLFGELRSLDGAGVDRILAEPCPDEAGLRHAIADRLRRAAHRD
jgi:L-threonylcarbamoyladenylate synthase